METAENKHSLSLINIVVLIIAIIMIAFQFIPINLPLVPKTFLLYGILIIPCIYYIAKTKTDVKETLKIRKLRIGDFFYCILIGFLIKPVVTCANYFSLIFTKPMTSETMYDAVLNLPLIVTVITVAIAPAVFEELICRGVLHSAYRAFNPFRAAWLSALIFGLMHCNLNQFCYAFVIGLIFSLMVEATGSIFSTMIVHFMVNVSSVISLYLLPMLYELCKKLCVIYDAMGLTQMRDIFTGLFGDLNLDKNEWFRQYLKQSIVTQSSIPASVAARLFFGSLPLAAIALVLIFLVWRRMSKRNNTWDDARRIFISKEKDKTSVMTIPLVIGCALFVLMIFFVLFVSKIPGGLQSLIGK